MKGSRFKLNQNHAPIHEALETFRRMRVVPFDVPGHKRGRGNPELTEFLGQKCVGVDVNSMKPLDNLCHPVSVIREAEELAADAFGAAHAFLMVGGTTSSVQTMVLTACKRGDEIILPRNVHRSVLNALVLCGAIPVYVNPEVDQRLGISLGMQREQVAKAIKEHPKAVAVLVNNPTYYGIFSYGSRRRYGICIHAQKRRQSYTVESASYRSGRTCRVCASDHQSDTDNIRKLSSDVES